MKQETKEKLGWILAGFGVVLLFALLLSIPIISAYFEAQSYNRVTGANVSTWDAIFLDLRVQESPKEQTNGNR
jgi:hypothetical protein